MIFSCWKLLSCINWWSMTSRARRCCGMHSVQFSWMQSTGKFTFQVKVWSRNFRLNSENARKWFQSLDFTYCCLKLGKRYLWTVLKILHELSNIKTTHFKWFFELKSKSKFQSVKLDFEQLTMSYYELPRCLMATVYKVLFTNVSMEIGQQKTALGSFS